MLRPAIPLNDEDRLLLRHILDLAQRSETSYHMLFSTFLDDRQLAICEAALKSEWVGDFVTLGGYPDAERRIIAFGAGSEDGISPPFKAVVFNHPEGLTHRDFLGSLMVLGIKRELLGDILVGKSRTAVFVYDTAFSESDIPVQEYDEIHSTVASLRLDAVIATGLRISRDRAAELIRSKGVMHNRVMTFSPSDKVAEGDRFSVRGFGKLELFEAGGQSRKDRLFITIRKFR